MASPAPRPLCIATWNVNSVRARLPRTIAFLERHRPDLLCLQETKVKDEDFPAGAIEEATGYTSWVHGWGGYNGVAFVVRDAMEDVERGFPDDPSPEDARVISGTVAGIRVVNAYVVNGKQVGRPEYALKLEWLDAFVEWIRSAHSPDEPLLVVGDFNVAPADLDVHDPDLWRGQNLCSEAERERVRALFDWGLVDLARLHHEGPGPFTWWDYRAGAFHRGWGLRIDLALATEPLARRCRGLEVERDERKPTFGEGKPSDHAPVIVTFDPD